jgi:2-polyprenyl-3-methyl-5-hydroxy-6-metoxy-1,4-benzoquinol methylase
MRNPWLDIPLADYEAHMALPTIGQSRLIADQLDILINTYSPDSVAVVGCAGGNGFDRLVGTGARRVVGVDINPKYIEQAQRRYAERISGLELYITDIQSSALIFEPVDLIYVALVFEYVDLAQTMNALRHHCKRDGVLAVLSQRPHETVTHVSPSPYTSLQMLAPRMRLVSPQELQQLAKLVGFSPEHSRVIASPGGKRFSVDEFRLRGTDGQTDGLSGRSA